MDFPWNKASTFGYSHDSGNLHITIESQHVSRFSIHDQQCFGRPTVWPDQFRSVALDTTLSLIIWTFFRLCPSGFRLPLIGTFIMMTWTNSNQHILKPSFVGTFMNVPLSHLFTRGSILSGVQSKFFFASCCWIWVVAGFNAGGNVWGKKGDGPQKQQFSPHLLPTGHFPWLS
jgi:hypothetical protein